MPKGKKTMANLEAFCLTISTSINLLFLKSVVLFTYFEAVCLSGQQHLMRFSDNKINGRLLNFLLGSLDPN